MTLPPANATVPSAPQDFAVEIINDTIRATWTAPVVLPSGTRFRVVAAPFSHSVVASKTIVWDGDTFTADFRLAPNSYGAAWFQVQGYRTTSEVGPYAPNTFGLAPAAPLLLAPTGFTGTGRYAAIDFTWGVSTGTQPGATFQLFEHAVSTPFASATEIWQGAGSFVSVPKTDVTTRYYWIRSAFLAAVSSPHSAVGLLARASSSQTAWDASVSPGSLNKSGTASTLTTGFAIVTVVASNAPTFAWAQLGGDSISINSSSLRSTQFNATGLAEWETRDGSFKCTVTDNSGVNSVALLVGVSIYRQGSGPPP